MSGASLGGAAAVFAVRTEVVVGSLDVAGVDGDVTAAPRTRCAEIIVPATTTRARGTIRRERRRMPTRFDWTERDWLEPMAARCRAIQCVASMLGYLVAMVKKSRESGVRNRSAGRRIWG